MLVMSSYRCAISDQKWCANWCASDDVMCHDHLCVSEKAKYFRSCRDYVVHLVIIRGNTILKDFTV